MYACSGPCVKLESLCLSGKLDWWDLVEAFEQSEEQQIFVELVTDKARVCHDERPSLGEFLLLALSISRCSSRLGNFSCYSGQRALPCSRSKASLTRSGSFGWRRK